MDTSLFYLRLCIVWHLTRLNVLYASWGRGSGVLLLAAKRAQAPMPTVELSLLCVLCAVKPCSVKCLWVLSFLATWASPNLSAGWHLVRAVLGGRYCYPLCYFLWSGTPHGKCNCCRWCNRWKLFVSEKAAKAEWRRQWPDWQGFQGESEVKSVKTVMWWTELCKS